MKIVHPALEATVEVLKVWDESPIDVVTMRARIIVCQLQDSGFISGRNHSLTPYAEDAREG